MMLFYIYQLSAYILYHRLFYKCFKFIFHFYLYQQYLIPVNTKSIQQQHSIIAMFILDFVFSVIAFVYFASISTELDACYYMAFAYNVIHAGCQLIIIIPLICKIWRRKSFDKIGRQYIKITVISHYRMPIFSSLMIILSICNLYSIIIQLFIWKNYTYLYITFSLICSSLTQVSKYIKIKLDYSIIFSLQTYKFFCLAISSILFCISINQKQLIIQLLGMGWIYFISRSKQSLPKFIIYYLILFLDIIIICNAIIVITGHRYTSQELTNNQQFKLGIYVLFFIFIFFMEIYQFIQLYKNFYQISKNQFNNQSIVLFYSHLQSMKSNIQIHQNNINQIDCIICLQTINNLNHITKGQLIKLNCNHFYHLQCLQQWAAISTTCPICRSSILQKQKQQLIF